MRQPGDLYQLGRGDPIKKRGVASTPPILSDGQRKPNCQRKRSPVSGIDLETAEKGEAALRGEAAAHLGEVLPGQPRHDVFARGGRGAEGKRQVT